MSNNSVGQLQKMFAHFHLHLSFSLLPTLFPLLGRHLRSKCKVLPNVSRRCHKTAAESAEGAGDRAKQNAGGSDCNGIGQAGEDNLLEFGDQQIITECEVFSPVGSSDFAVSEPQVRYSQLQ
jgi:hypothetical protein